MEKTAERKAVYVAREGPIRLPVYELGSGRFMFRYDLAGQTHEVRKSALVKAKHAADQAVIQIAKGQAQASALTAIDREIYLRAKSVATEHGVTILQILHEWTEQKQRQAAYQGKTASDVLQLYLGTQHDAKHSARYMRGLEKDLAHFCEHFPGIKIGDITSGAIEEYLREQTFTRLVTKEMIKADPSLEGQRTVELKIGIRRRNNLRAQIVTFFRFAVDRGYLPEGRTQAEKVSKIDDADHQIEVFTPKELQLLLASAKEEWLPWIAISAFAGMRSEEICLPHSNKRGEIDQLAWEDFRWEKKYIDVSAIISKTARRRYVPITDALADWLSPWRDAKGPVIDREKGGRYYDESARLAEVTGVRWVHNGLRHGYGTYWMALHHDMAKLADQMGNSVQMIRNHYDARAEKTIAEEWFAIRRTIAANVLNLRFG